MNSVFPPRQRMRATGIGFAGLEGAWWLPARAPFVLPLSAARDLAEIGQAIFVLLDVAAELYHTDAWVKAHLEYKVPADIPRLMSAGRVDCVRPDFQLVATPRGYRFVATELESCPASHGFVHAMQVGYGLSPDLAESFARYLHGRTLLIVGTEQWSEFLIEQLAFCRALEEAGARGVVLYDRPLAVIAEEFRQGKRWQPPMFGVASKPAQWNDDLLGRLRADDLLKYAWPSDEAWPEQVGDAVIFRFGYFDCFAPDRLDYFLRWQARGATLLNPAQFILESKAIMSALDLARVRLAVTHPGVLSILRRCLPKTELLQENWQAHLADKDNRVLKFAGFDRGHRAWGGRSVQMGAAHTPESWEQALRQAVRLLWPVVIQEAVPSARVDIEYVGADDQAQVMQAGNTRLRAFFLREGDYAVVCGAHLTVSRSAQVSEAVDSVQAPVVFRG
jgi:hypothetical protein